jgi:hypothetical protein
MSRPSCPVCQGGWIKVPNVPVQRVCDVCHGRTTVSRRFLRRYESRAGKECWECGLLQSISGNSRASCSTHLPAPTERPPTTESGNNDPRP